jgi:hypothetical protein
VKRIYFLSGAESQKKENSSRRSIPLGSARFKENAWEIKENREA